MENHALKFRPYTGAIARHYKGGVYTILATASHTETNEEVIVYRDSYNRMFVRPAAMFFGRVDKLGCNRFEYVGRESDSPMGTKVNSSYDEAELFREKYR